jgi:hypothetical protein
VLSNLYTVASARSSGTRGSRSETGANLASQVLAIVVICCIGVTAGSAAGKGIELLRSSDQKPAAAADTKAEARAEAPAPPPAQPEPQIVAAPGAITVAAAPKPAVAPAPKPKPVAKAPVAPAPIVAPAAGPQAAQSAARCAADQVMDDGKINWLLEQSAKTLAENPGQAAGAARVNADLRSALGKNLCAAEVKTLIAGTCTDPAAVKFLNTMVSRLPFFIKPMVGNPCTADLVAVLNKVSRFMS